MRAKGYSVLRFWSHDILKQRRAICETILAALDGRLAENVASFDMRFVFASGENNQHQSEQLTFDQQV